MSFWNPPAELDARLWRVLGGVFISFFGVGLTLPYLLVYLHDVRDIGLSAASLVLAWMSVVAITVTPFGGRAIDRAGPWIVLIVALAAAALGSFGIAASTSLVIALAATAVTTSGWTVAMSAESTMLSRLAHGASKEWVFGGQYMVSTVALGIGALISGLVINTENPSTFVWIYVVDGITYLLYVGVLFTMPGVGNVDADEDEVEPAGRFRDALADRTFRRFLVACTIFFVCMAGQIESGFPAYATQVADVDPKVLAFAFLSNTVLVAAGQFLLIPRLIGRRRTTMLTFCGVVWAVSWFIVGMAGLSAGTLLAAGLVIGGLVVFAVGEVVAAPVAPALVNDLAPEHVRGSYNSAFGLTFSIGATAGPLVTAVTIGTGHPALWVAFVCSGCLVAALLIFRLGRELTPMQQGSRVSP